MCGSIEEKFRYLFTSIFLVHISLIIGVKKVLNVFVLFGSVKLDLCYPNIVMKYKRESHLDLKSSSHCKTTTAFIVNVATAMNGYGTHICDISVTIAVASDYVKESIGNNGIHFAVASDYVKESIGSNDIHL